LGTKTSTQSMIVGLIVSPGSATNAAAVPPPVGERRDRLDELGLKREHRRADRDENHGIRALAARMIECTARALTLVSRGAQASSSL
jgi:hypothetical protein